jgi:hypothetical protein
MDGSVLFVNDSVDTGAETNPVRRLMNSPNGSNSADPIRNLPPESFWGVWGAMGTRNGKEGISL